MLVRADTPCLRNVPLPFPTTWARVLTLSRWFQRKPTGRSYASPVLIYTKMAPGRGFSGLLGTSLRAEGLEVGKQGLQAKYSSIRTYCW